MVRTGAILQRNGSILGGRAKKPHPKRNSHSERHDGKKSAIGRWCSTPFNFPVAPVRICEPNWFRLAPGSMCTSRCPRTVRKPRIKPHFVRSSRQFASMSRLEENKAVVLRLIEAMDHATSPASIGYALPIFLPTSWTRTFAAPRSRRLPPLSMRLSGSAPYNRGHRRRRRPGCPSCA